MRFFFCALIVLVLNAWIGQVAIIIGAMEDHCKDKKFLALKVKPPNFTSDFFANLHVPTLITSFCDDAFKIKSPLYVASLMFRMVQQQGTNMFLLLKICIDLNFFLIAIDNYEICLQVFECRHIKDWNVASCNSMKF